MKGILYNKRGELTTKQIVVMIVLIISFVIILFFIFQLSPRETADKQVCHDSVVLRGNSLIGGQVLPLNCKTSYIYVTASSQKSNERLGDPDRVVEVRTKEDVYKFLAEEMHDCWWMFGRGEIDYLGEIDYVSNSYCSICSQVVFDESVKKIFSDNGGKIDKDDFYNNYLTRNVPGKEYTYSEFLLGTSNPGDFLSLPYESDENKEEDRQSVETPQSWGGVDLDKTQIIVMAINSDVSTAAWAITGGLVAAGVAAAIVAAPFTGGTSLVTAVGIIAVAAAGATGALAGAVIVAPVIEGASGKRFVPPTIMELDSLQYKSLGCIEIKSLS